MTSTVSPSAAVEMLDFPAVSGRVRLGRTTVYKMIATGEFPPPVKIGPLSRWRSDDIDRWIDQVSGRSQEVA